MSGAHYRMSMDILQPNNQQICGSPIGKKSVVLRGCLQGKLLFSGRMVIFGDCYNRLIVYQLSGLFYKVGEKWVTSRRKTLIFAHLVCIYIVEGGISYRTISYRTPMDNWLSYKFLIFYLSPLHNSK